MPGGLDVINGSLLNPMNTSQPLDSGTSSVSRTAWLIVGLLFPVALLNYLDRQMIASMKVSVMGDLKDIGSEENWGHMLASFKWVYAIFSPIGGYIADRFSRKYTICGSLFVWSLITYLTGHVNSFDDLYWARTAMGISEAFYIPAALALIADFHTGPTRSRAVGVHQMGIYCGVMVGGFAGYAADWPDFGWRGAFDITGLVGILYAIPLLFLLKDAPRSAAELANPVAKPSVGTAITELFTNPSFLLLVLYFTLPALAAWVVRDWMPAILQKEFNISQGKAGVSAALYWQGAALVSAIFGGWLADRWMRKTPRGRIYVSAIGMLCIIPALFGVGNAPALGSFTLAVAALILFGVGWGFFDCNNMPILSQVARPELRATGYGIMNFVSMMCGGVADWGFGFMRDKGVALNVIFGVFAAVCVVSAFLVLLIRPREHGGARL
ncbi:MFS transporter [Prosthecobacter algae]|uniref:MFS transporter n=2 Tax=Prosthecobacter algae TaxID=1144682 RepID=A0ABP9P5T9_9BACT